MAEKFADKLQKIEDGVVGTYKKIEDGVTGAYQKVEDKFVNTALYSPLIKCGEVYSVSVNTLLSTKLPFSSKIMATFTSLPI